MSWIETGDKSQTASKVHRATKVTPTIQKSRIHLSSGVVVDEPADSSSQIASRLSQEPARDAEVLFAGRGVPRKSHRRG